MRLSWQWECYDSESRHYVILRLISDASRIHYSGMTRYFASRAEQVEHVRRLVRSDASGSIVVTGQPGMGRTAFLKSTLDCADPHRDEIVLLDSTHERPFTTLRHNYLPSMPDSMTVRDAADMTAARARGHRLVIAADDGHQMDYSSLLVFRELVRRGLALFIVTRPAPSSRLNTADPTTCLGHERDVQTITLLPLSVSEVAEVLSEIMGEPAPRSVAEAAHAATGGNPGLLRALVPAAGIAEDVTAPPADGTYPGIPRLVHAARDAWHELALSRAETLCRFALRCGARDEIAPIWAMLLLLEGRTGECMSFLESPGAPGREAPHLVMVRALALAFGFGQASEACELLLAAASDPDQPAVLHAFRAWLLAVCDRAGNARRVMADISRGDHSTALFIHAANAALAQSDGQHAESVFHLRRAIAVAEAADSDFPWVRPYLRASLIGSLTLCDRVKEATSAAQNFHAREPSSGWKVAVSLDSLFSRSIPVSQFPGAEGSYAFSPHCPCGKSEASPYGQQVCARSNTRSCSMEVAISSYKRSAPNLLQER